MESSASSVIAFDDHQKAYRNEAFVADISDSDCVTDFITKNDHKNKSSFETSIHQRKNSENEISLAWRNLRYEAQTSNIEFFFTSKFSKNKSNSSQNPSLKKNHRSKVIIRRTTGHVRFHTLNGFMGPSGAGKTTLMNCLNGTIRNLSQGSEIFITNNDNSVKNYPMVPTIAVIGQHVHEMIIGRLMVKEILQYAYRFKNNSTNEDNRQSSIDQHIQQTIENLLLDPKILLRRFDQCSGGEQKRIAVAQELMSLQRPTLLFIDEPTTGLDSQAALLVMKCLRQLTIHYRMSVLISIHLPSDEILGYFDQLFILAKGGVCIYADRPDRLSENLERKLGIEINKERLPVEEYIRLACNGIQDEKVQSLANETLKAEHSKLLTLIDENQSNSQFQRYESMPRQYKSFNSGDLFLQLQRIFHIVFVVDYPAIIYQMVIYVCFYLAISTVFNHDMVQPSMCYPLIISESDTNNTCQKHVDDETYAGNYITYQCYCVMFFGVIVLGLGAILFAPMLKVFRNEHRNRWYSMSTFYWSFTAVRFIEMTIYSLVITLLIYFPVEHHYIDQYRINWFRLGHFAFFIWLSCFYMQSYGQLLSLIFVDRTEISIVMGQLWFIVLGLVNGYLINLAHMNNRLLYAMSDVLATKPISNGLLYSFYGIERCRPDTEISMMIVKFNIDEKTIYTDLRQVFINIFVLRLSTLALMYIKFSHGRSSSSSLMKKMINENDSQKPKPAIIPIDYEFVEHPVASLRSCNAIIEQQNVELSSTILSTSTTSDTTVNVKEQQRISVAWKSLSLFGSGSWLEIQSVKRNFNNPNLILRNLSGSFRFGTLNALMGTSGAGKTSLLNVLTGRWKTRLSEESRIYLSRYRSTIVCYLTQEVSGHLWPGLTAKQSLIYASMLKNSFVNKPSTLHYKDHEQIAIRLMNELDISSAADTLAQHCSSGEQKRLALALELTATSMPTLVCIDEPTSGLDSNSAQVVIRCLHRLVKHHRTNGISIVASIHQPNTETLMLFDQCYVLARGGVCIYSGSPEGIRQHLFHVPDVDCTGARFPVENLIKYSCHDHSNSIVQKLVNITDRQTLRTLNSVDNETFFDEVHEVIDGIQPNRARFSLWHSVKFLCYRYGIYVKKYLWIYLLIYIFIYLIYGAILRYFFNSKIALVTGCISLEEDFVTGSCNRSTEKIEREIDLTSNYRYNFYFTILFLFIVTLQSSLIFSKEIIYFINEHHNGWYSTGSFYLMKSLYDIVPMIPVLIIYVWIIDIYEPVRPGIYWWLVLMITLAVIGIQGLGHLISLLTNGHFTTLTITNIGVFFLLIILSNFFNPIGRMHYVYQMLSNLSICRFLNEGTLLLQYGFERCGHKQLQVILYMMMLEHDQHFYHCLQMLVFNLILYRVLALLALMFKVNPTVDNRRQRAYRILEHHSQLKPAEANIPGIQSHHEFRVKKIIL